MRFRLLLGALGAALIGYGSYQLLHDRGATHPVEVAKWLVIAVLVHDGILAWAVVLVGWMLARAVPGRARPYVQGGLICAALITVITLPLIHRRGKAAPGSTLLTQNYPAHLAILLGTVAAAAVGAYAVGGLSERRHGRSRANDRPPTDHTSPTQ
jgi:hypothetical protein